MKKLICLFIFISFFLHAGESKCRADKRTNSDVDSDIIDYILDTVDRGISHKYLPSLSDFESQYRKTKKPSDTQKLQYCDLMIHALPLHEIFKRKDLIEICEYFGNHINSVNLSANEKCRALILGILLSTSRDEEVFFSNKLASIDPENAFVTVIKIKNSILYGDVDETEKLIRRFVAQEKLDLYIKQGYQNQYDIWTSFFGENLQSFQSLMDKQYGGLECRKIMGYASVFWSYDADNKYQKSEPIYEGLSLDEYFSLDQMFLHKIKMSAKDFSWHASMTNIQLKFFYRLYYDSTLYYASGITTPKQHFFTEDNERLNKAKQNWLSKRDQLQETIFAQRKEIYELVKASILTSQKIKSLDSAPDSKYIQYLKLCVQGNETQFLNNLKDYDSNQSNNLIDTSLLPLIEKEKQFWLLKLAEKQEEAKEVEVKKDPPDIYLVGPEK